LVCLDDALVSLCGPSHLRAPLPDLPLLEHVLLHERLKLEVALVVMLDQASDLPGVVVGCGSLWAERVGYLLASHAMRLALQPALENGAAGRRRRLVRLSHGTLTLIIGLRRGWHNIIFQGQALRL